MIAIGLLVYAFLFLRYLLFHSWTTRAVLGTIVVGITAMVMLLPDYESDYAYKPQDFSTEESLIPNEYKGCPVVANWTGYYVRLDCDGRGAIIIDNDGTPLTREEFNRDQREDAEAWEDITNGSN